MDPISRRAHARVECDLPVEVFGGATEGGRVGGGYLVDLSLAGALLAYDGELSASTPYRVRLQTAEAGLDIPFRITRETARSPGHTDLRHYGLVFNLTSDQERALRKIVDARRPRPEPPAEESLLRRLRRRLRL